jgi:glycosyltransferase involved in cell wall biosynthesis
MAKRQLDLKSRILYVSSGGELAGAERCLLEMASRLNRDQFEVYVVVPFEGQLSEELRKKRIRVHVIELGTIRSRVELTSPLKMLLRVAQIGRASIQVAHLIRTYKIDIVHSNTSAVYAGAISAKLLRRHHVWHLREIIITPHLLWRITRFLTPRMSDKVICVSKPAQDHLQLSVSPSQKKLTVIHDGIDLLPFSLPQSPTAGDRDEGELIVGMVSRITPRKGQDVFIQAASIVNKVFPLAKFYIVGDCLEVYQPVKDALVTTATQLEIEQQITFTGYLDHESIARVLATFDVFVSPSKVPESFGLVIAEAMAAGKPVVATKHGGPLDLIIDGVTGLLIPSEDPAAMANAIINLLRDKAKRQSMGQSGKARVRECFSIDKHLSLIESLYRDILKS